MPNPFSSSPGVSPRLTSSPYEFRKQLENLAEEYECLHQLHQALLEGRLRAFAQLSASGETPGSAGGEARPVISPSGAQEMTHPRGSETTGSRKSDRISPKKHISIEDQVGPHRRSRHSARMKKALPTAGMGPLSNIIESQAPDPEDDCDDLELPFDRYPTDMIVSSEDAENDELDQNLSAHPEAGGYYSSEHGYAVMSTGSILSAHMEAENYGGESRVDRAASFRSHASSACPPRASGATSNLMSQQSHTSSASWPARRQTNSITSQLAADGLFPRWFDPGLTPQAPAFGEAGSLDCSEQCSMPTIASSGHHESLRSESKSPPDFWTISPVSTMRISWDSLALMCLLLELWIIPFGMVFLDGIDPPGFMQVLSIVITCFFSLDIVLNFFTGYVENDTTVMNRGKIFWNYLRFWFWIDLISTFPFDLILNAMSGGVSSIIRVGKAPKVFKTLRYLKLLRIARLVKISHQAASVTTHFHSFSRVRKVFIPMQVVLFLCLFAHIHGCVWAALQPEWVDVQSVVVALERYWESFWWAYTAVTVGSLGAQHAENHKGYSSIIFLLEMVIATERMLFFTIASLKVSFEALKYADDAQRAHTRMDVLKYLRTHNVCFDTQIQVLFSLRDTDGAQKMQRYFDEMTKLHLPRELRRSICAELWNSKLMSLGLLREISNWHFDFVTELAQLVYEEVHPSKAILFKAYEASIAAYYIIRGELAVSTHPEGRQVPNFTTGMWVGENALASSTLRRSATLTTTSVTSIMALRGEDFQELLSRLGLMEEFEKFCGEQLWRGLCGRCGMLGDHFSDSCTAHLKRRPPVTRRKAIGAFAETIHEGDGSMSIEPDPFVKRRTSFRELLTPYEPTEEITVESRSLSRELKRFLAHVEMHWIGPTLLEVDVHDLSELECLDMAVLRAACMDASGETLLTAAQENSLSAASIRKFREKQASSVHRTLFHQVSRLQHLIFLSHYKLEAGTEAALLRTEIEQAIAKDPGSLGHRFEHPVFLDSEDLNNLEDLQQRVRHTHNLVLLLTKGIFERPWVLVEILTARQEGVRVQPVNITKPGSEFVFPDSEFYRRLREGSMLDQAAMDEICARGFTLEDLEDAIRAVFLQIAVPYSPHKTQTIRQAEVDKLLRNCRLKSETTHKRRKTHEDGHVDKKTSIMTSGSSLRTRSEGGRFSRRTSEPSVMGSMSPPVIGRTLTADSYAAASTSSVGGTSVATAETFNMMRPVGNTAL